jgi:hypothetical protein
MIGKQEEISNTIQACNGYSSHSSILSSVATAQLAVSQLM